MAQCIPLVVDFDVTLLVTVVVALPTVFLVAAAVTFPLGLAVPALLEPLLTLLLELELFFTATIVIVAFLVLVVSVMVVLGGEVEDSTFTRFTTGPFCGNDINVYGVEI